ncbi:hypothetical protein Leryth_014534 [Lithospermum erythrorhizon]|nr:hypothetical protein Leryth_014534 [Lithospermum erythrorhizon]
MKLIVGLCFSLASNPRLCGLDFKYPLELHSTFLAMEDVNSKEERCLNPDYPSLRVVSYPEKDEEGALKPSEDANNTPKTVQEMGLRQMMAIGCGSLSRIKVHTNETSQESAPNSKGGFGSLVSSPDLNNEDGSNIVPSYDNSPSNHQNLDAIDTKAPIESVKDAVSKFGGILDWKAHKEQTVERRKLIETELDKAQEEIPMCKKECADAEEDRFQVLRELEMTNEHIEELKLHLEKAHREEQQAKQESQQAKLRVEEFEKGIDNEVTISAKAQLEIAKTRHAAAIAELKIVRDEFEKLQNDFSLLASERDAAIKKAEEAVVTSKEVEKRIEYLAIELINTKASLEAVNAEHLEGEKIRAGKAMAINEEMLNIEKELKEAEEDLQRLDKEICSARDLKSQIDAASTLLQSLKGELSSYMDSKLNQENDGDNLEKLENMSKNNIHTAIASAKKELEQVRANLEKTIDGVSHFKVFATSLQSDGTKSPDVASVEAELNSIRSQVMKAMEESAQAKLVARAMESQLLATQKEIEAAKYSNKLADTATDIENSPNVVTLSMEEYLDLSKQAQAKESETTNLHTLEEMKLEIDEKKETLQIELEKAEIAKKGKLEAEQKWRSLRAEHDQKQLKAGQEANEKNKGKRESVSLQQRSPRSGQAPIQEHKHTKAEIEQNYKEILSLETSMAKKKKKFIFPKFFMFMGKKKAS